MSGQIWAQFETLVRSCDTLEQKDLRSRRLKQKSLIVLSLISLVSWRHNRANNEISFPSGEDATIKYTNWTTVQYSKSIQLHWLVEGCWLEVAIDNHFFVKWLLHKKKNWQFCHNLLISISFQTCMIFYLLWSIKDDILKNDGNLTVSVHTGFHYMEVKGNQICYQHSSKYLHCVPQKK